MAKLASPHDLSEIHGGQSWARSRLHVFDLLSWREEEISDASPKADILCMIRGCTCLHASDPFWNSVEPVPVYRSTYMLHTIRLILVGTVRIHPTARLLQSYLIFTNWLELSR